MTIILFSSVIAIVVYCCFTVVLVRGISRLKPGSNSENTSITIVVAAHNEAENINSCLKSLLRQSYPKALTEIIVVNDRSDDQTVERINHLKKYNTILKSIDIYSVPKNISPKKFALDAGIQQAKDEVILTTDADCRPPENWTSIMMWRWCSATSICQKWMD